MPHIVLKALDMSRKTMPVSLFLPHFSSTKPHYIATSRETTPVSLFLPHFSSTKPHSIAMARETMPVSLFLPHFSSTKPHFIAMSRETMPVSLFLPHFSPTKPHSVSSKLDHSKTLIQISKDYKKISWLYMKLISHILHIWKYILQQ